jgi:CelD/BcsL family acetyltransferase involved in cellulose biosynthesis
MIQTGFTVDVYQTLTPELEQRWRALEDVSDLTPFQSIRFAKPWYDVFAGAGDCEPCIVVVRSIDSGRDVMLLPLCRRHDGQVRVVEFADGGVSDYNAPVLLRDVAISKPIMSQIWQQIIASLPSADWIKLEKVPLTINGRTNPLTLISAGLEMQFGAHFLPLHSGSSLHGAATTTVPSNYAAKLNTEKRRLEKHGTLQLETAVGQRIGDLFAALADQRRSRSTALGRRDTLEDPRIRLFYEKLVDEGPQTGFCRLDAMTLNSDVLATALGLSYRGTYYLLLPAFADGQWSRHSPGNLLLYLQMLALQGTGHRGYDFTIGDESYKARFGARRAALQSITQPLTLKGRAVSLNQRSRLLWRRRSEFSQAGTAVFKRVAGVRWKMYLAATLGVFAFADL